MKATLQHPLFSAFLVLFILLSTGLTGTGVQAALVNPQQALEVPISESNPNNLSGPNLPEAVPSVEPSGCYALTLEVIGGMGEPPLASEPNCEGGLYQPGSVVVLTAQPAEGFFVHRWQGTDDDASTALTNHVTMDADRTAGVHYVNDKDPHETVTGGTPGGVAIVPQPPAGPDGAQTVIGTDDRTRITSTTSLPWRRNAFLAVTFPWATSTCTGWFAGPDLVITTGHCVYQSELGGWAQQIRVVPGKNGSSEPYGSQYASGIGSVNGWVQNGMPEYDYGYIKLPNSTLGNKVGWYRYGYFGDAYLAGLNNVTVAGYPADKSTGTQWKDSGQFGLPGYYFLNYAIDTSGGQSGAPIWYQGTDGQYYVTAVHAYANGGGYPCAYDSNCGVRVSKWMAENFQAWGAPTSITTDCSGDDIPTLLAPAISETVYSDPVTFSWSPVSGSSGYILQVGNDQIYTENPTYVFPGLEKNYQDWRVRSIANYFGCPDSEYTDWRRVYISAVPPPVSVSASYLTYDDKIRVTWSGVAMATAYDIYRTTEYHVYGDLIATSTDLYFDDFNIDFSNYYYRIKACSGYRCSDGHSMQATGRRIADPLNPYDFQASDGLNTSKLWLTWIKNSNYAYYEIYRSESPQDIGSLLVTLNNSYNFYEDYTTALFTTHYYRLRPCSETQCSDYSRADAGIRLWASPTNQTASDGTYADHVAVSWSAVTGAEFYQIYRSTTAEDLGELVGSYTSSPADDLNGTADQVYYYSIKACVSSGCSIPAVDRGWRAGSVPDIPVNVVASENPAHYIPLTIQWDTVPRATYYEIYRSASSEEYGEKIANSTSTSYTDSATPGILYYYRVKACNVVGCSNFSNSDTGWRGLDYPTVTASSLTHSEKIQITWTVNQYATYYELYRSTTWDNFGEMIVSTTETFYDDFSASIAVSYLYTIKACNEDRCSHHSGRSLGKLGLAVPTSVSASDGSIPDRVQVTWDSVPNAFLYKVYRTTDPADGVNPYRITTNSYVDANAEPDVTYYYKIQACYDEHFCGLISGYDTGWRTVSIPAPPPDLIASDDDGIVELTWRIVGGATYYELYRSTSPSSYGTLIPQKYPSQVNDIYYTYDSPPFLTTFYYRVKSCSNLGCSDYSDYDSGWVDLEGPRIQGTEGDYFDRVIITWQASNYASYYQVYRTIPSQPGEYELLGETDATFFNDFTAYPGQAYSYKAKSCIEGECGSYGTTGWGWRLMDSTAAIDATRGLDDKILVTWSNVVGAKYYKIYAAYYYDVWGELAGISETNSFTDLLSPPGPKIYYRILACSHGENYCGFLSDTYGFGWRSITIPHASATDGSLTDRIHVSWEAIPDISSYQVYRSASAGQQGELIATVSEAFFDDTGVPPGPTYYYGVKACSQSYCSTLSPSEPGWRGVGVPAGLLATDDQSSGIMVTWEAVADIPTYEIYRTLLPDGVQRLVAAATTAAFNDTTAIPGYSYEYQVRSCYEANCSALSSAESGTRTMPAPAGLGQHDDSGGMVFYEGGWVAEDTGTALNGTLHSTESMGDFAVFFFEGRCASLHFTAGKQFGQIDIYLDDVYLSTLSQYIPGPGVPLQTAPLCGLDGLHTLRLVSAGVERINIDAISVVEPVEYQYQYFAPLFR